MAATTELKVVTGSGSGTAVLADALKASREDSKAGTTPIPVPTATGVNYSWLKNTYLDVTVVSSSAATISNRTVKQDTAAATGIRFFFKTASSYVQADNSNRPADTSGSNTAVPSGYTLLSTSPTQYDNTSVSSTILGRNGLFLLFVLAIDATSTASTSTNSSLPGTTVAYDEV